MTGQLNRLGIVLLLGSVPVTGVLLLFLAGELEASPTGLGDPGALTVWVTPVAQAARDISSALTVGALVVAACVLPSNDRETGDLQRRLMRWAIWTGGAWFVSSVTVLLMNYSQVAGASLFTPGTSEQVRFFVLNFEIGRWLLTAVLLSGVVFTLTALATRVTTVGLAALAGIGALLPLAFVGHSATSTDHGLAVDAQMGHLVGVAVWTGGLAALVVVRKHLGEALPVAVQRFSVLSGWCFGLSALAGIVSAWARIGSWEGLLSFYGALLLAKIVLLVLLGAAGWYHRRRILPQVADPKAFWRIVLGEILVIALATGTAVALGRVSPGGAGAAEDLNDSLLGYPMPPPLDAAAWFTTWRADILWGSLSVLAVFWYLRSVARLRRRGDKWPVGRTLAWLIGCVLAFVAVNGSPGAYGSVLFSMHMIQHMTIAMAVPAFLVLGAPVTLALRTLPVRRDGSRGPREWLLLMVHSRYARFMAHPLVAPVNLVGSLVVFYNTPLFELSVRTHSGHLVMMAHFILGGYLFANMICGIDPGPSRPPYPFRIIIFMATFGLHSLFIVSMMGSTEILAQEWFSVLDRSWGPSLEDDQQRGWQLAWALGDYPLGLLATALIAGWIASDAREARRHDRQADRDGEATLNAYNAYLQKLGGRR
ncbi:bifunctional copper resistance protein CopD/cytochrome c oxidase assembly protein [Kineosporia rhizophila]|uniref:cytochrome c oxidase assembly protein n=1 Tax=Kineosporia rhizophila TaxID=84633 RepID=UPI000A7F0C2C|nr:cytochrome c oxidase assembly protein [Kineosporia rhizophila]MCE0536120.1 bifunctional copper resistance protein CopD/cytochrome c oxidase assembly protein [Kineosporia rhizophila]